MIKKAIKKWLGIDYLEREAEWNKKHVDETIKLYAEITNTLKKLTEIIVEMNKQNI